MPSLVDELMTSVFQFFLQHVFSKDFARAMLDAQPWGLGEASQEHPHLNLVETYTQ